MNLTDDDIKFLREMAHDLKTQDNRATGAPYYYVVREFKEVVGMDSNYSDDLKYVNLDGNDPEYFDSEEKAIAAIKHWNRNFDGTEGMTDEEAQAYFDKHFEGFGTFNYRVDHNVFLTYKGYLEHMRLNGHNYSYEIDGAKYGPEQDKKKVGGVYSYLQHAFRNPEMAKLIEIIKKFGE